MTRRKSVCLKWTLVLLVVIVCPYVNSRPQDTASVKADITTETSLRDSTQNAEPIVPESTPPPEISSSATPESSRNVKNKVPLRESIKLVANQLLDKPNVTDTPVVIDTRIPPKLKNQTKHKIKTRNEEDESSENAHAGEAVPISMEELETEKTPDNESTTSNEGISTWVLVSNPASKENATASTEPTKTDDAKKQKPTTPKNKNKKPNNKNQANKRPIIGSINKSDLVAGGSALNDNVLNKIKDTVLSNVQKNKNTNAHQQPTTTKATTTTTTTTPAPLTEAPTTKKEVTKAPGKVVSSTTKPKTKKKNKRPVSSESAMLPVEAKEQEIELEVSTPPVTTKKPKKNKHKKRKTKPSTSTSVAEIKTSTNKTKTVKHSKKPQTAQQGAITSQLYNYFSREIMPSVGVGVLGLASIVGIASYFLYPFSTPVRRNFEVDKRDDLYKNNAEDYANDGNGQAEEEMLGTVLAGMPAHAKSKLNPYAGQTAYINRYPVKKEQDIRYRQVAAKYEPTYNPRYPQQKTGLAHGVVYSKPYNYNPPQYETRHAYTTEGKFNFDKLPSSYSPYPAVEPIYAAPQIGPSSADISSYGNDASNSVVYGVKPSPETDFKPVYPFEAFYSETTSSAPTYAPTSLYLGSNNDAEQPEEQYPETSSEVNEDDENKFVVGNVPKELTENATPAVVPEHGPRKLRKRRSAKNKRSISTSIEEMLKKEKDDHVFISNEIDDSYSIPIRNLAQATDVIPITEDLPTPSKSEDVFTVYAASVVPTSDISTTPKNDVVESVSTIPINNEAKEKTTESDTANDVETTTKSFKVYEVFSPESTSRPIVKEVTTVKPDTTTYRNMMTETTTTELKSETTSTLSPYTELKDPMTSIKPTPLVPEVVTYPATNEPFSFLRRLIEFKAKVGLSLAHVAYDVFGRFLKAFDKNTTESAQRFAKASQKLAH